MKTKLKLITSIFCILMAVNNGYSQSTNKKTETFKIYGNCGMCKETIEASLKKKDGILKKNWDTKTKMITVTYDPTKITLEKIHQKIASVGYDTDKAKAKDEVYDKLHTCCKYERPKK